MSYYDDLGLPPTATGDEIRARYREAAMVAHPDHGGDPVVFRLLTEAYEVLADPAARRAYDAELGRDRAGSAGPTSRTSSSTSTADDRWATAETWGAPQRGQFYAETFEGLFSLSGSDLPRMVRWVLIGAVPAAAVGAGIGLFTGQATALAFGFGLPAAIVAILAFGHARYRHGQ